MMIIVSSLSLPTEIQKKMGVIPGGITREEKLKKLGIFDRLLKNLPG